MKKHLLFGVACLLLSLNSIGQVSIIESFDSGTPAGWTDSYLNTTTQACAGNSERDNLYSGSSTGNMTSPNQVAASNGTDITFSIDYKVVDWSAATVATADGWGAADLQFSTDDGATWTTAITLDDTNDSNSNVCTTLSTTISGTLVAIGSDLKFQVSNTWAAGDYYFYIDNFTATQVSANPPNCDAALTSATTDFPIDGTLTWSAASGAPTGYKISVGSSSGGTDIANNFDVGTATSYTPTGLGYDASYFVTITPYNTNGDATGCSEESFATEANPATDLTVNCGTPETESFCYDNLEDNTWLYTSDDGSSLKISFTAGGMEGCCDDIIIYDGSDNTAPVLYSGNNGGDLTGLEATSTGSSIFVAFDSDITVSCVSSGYVPADWSVECLSCTPGAGTASVGSCDAVNGIMLDVDVTSLGDGIIIIKNNIDATEITVTTTGVTAIGPFAFSSNVTVTLAHETDANCDVSLPAISLASGCPPTNDECSGAVVLTHEAEGSCTNTSSTLVNSTQSQAACVGSGDNDVWFSFEATATSAIIDVTGGPDIVTEVFEEGSGCSALGASIICSDPNDPTVTGLTVGNTYYIRINVWSTLTTPSAFDICVTTPAEPPLNDDCVNAEIVGMIPLDGTCIDVSGTTEAATNSGFVPSCDFAGTDYDVFYSFTAPAGGVVILEETSGTADPLEMVVLDDCAGTEIGTCGSFPQTVSGLTPGTMYILDVWNDDFENPGTFDICFKIPPACTAPIVDNILIDFTNCPASATITFDVTDIGSSPPLVVSNDAGGTNPADITETGTYSITNLPTSGNMSFTLTNIDPLCNVTEGPFTLACPPTNDDVADATAITLDMGCTGDAYTNLYSNGETGEVVGSCFGSTTATNSVWFTFEAPSSGSVNITNDIVGDGTGDLTDAQLAVYSTTDPTDFTSFTEEACSEDDGSNVGLGYMNDIDVTGLTGGGTYYILIDGYGTATGDFCLEINTLCDADTKVVLPTVTTTAIAADACTDFADGFTYYDDGTGNYIFAIDWAPDGTISTANQAAKDATTVEITKYSQSGSGSGAYDAPGNSPTQSSFALLTSWNVNLGAESIDEPVDVKFYYDPAEKTAVDDAANALADPNGGTWYKNEGADYNHDPVVTPEDFQDNVTLLTDVSGGGSDNGVTYARFDGVASFSGGSYGAGAGSGLLPIKLTRFTAKQDGRQNMIKWSTASEINVEDHTLIKSDDAINWEALGVVDGEISSNSNIDYEMMDVSPFATTYYQLMTTDIDGTTSYSPIVSVTRDSERSSEFLGASPVPTRDVVNLNVYVSADDNITITLIDISGKKIFVDNRAISSGDHQLPLDLSNMTNGVYMVTITSSYIQQTHRVIKN